MSHPAGRASAAVGFPARRRCPLGGAALVALLAALAVPLRGQGDSPYGRRIVEVRSRPASVPLASLSLQPGQALTPAGLSAAFNEVRTFLAGRAEAAVAFAGGGVLSFTYVTADFAYPSAPADAGVTVTLRPYHLSVPLGDPGARILSGPRDLAFSLAPGRTIPAWLPATLSLGSDRVLGPTLGGRWQGQAGPFAADQRSRLLRLRAEGSASLDSAWHSAAGEGRWVRDWLSGGLRQVTAGLEGAVARTPRGTERLDRRAAGATAGVAIALDANTRLRYDTRWAQTRERVGATGPMRDWREAAEWGHRILYETIPAGLLGFLRAAVWHETAAPREATSVRRLVARAGYAKEFPVGRNRSIGLEVIAGAGQAWGPVTASRRFYAGGSQGEFLQENASAPALANLPEGPLLRSLGRAQGGLAAAGGRGGTRFRHVNLSLALPVPRWSRPLIPDEPTDLPGPDGTPQTLQQLLRTQVDRTGPNLLQSSLQVSDGLTPDEARRRADRIFGEIRPATHFIIEQANVFAVKPLLLFDAAEIEAGPERTAWTAAGAGLQLVVVTAKLDLGYMHTLSGPRYGARGSVFARLGFERLF